MNRPITDYAIKSYVEQIIKGSYDIRNVEISSISRDLIISTLWSWISRPDNLKQLCDADELINILRQEFRDEGLIDTGILQGRQTFEIQLSNVRYYIMRMSECTIINAVQIANKYTVMTGRPPMEMVRYMRAFNDLIPEIHRHIDKKLDKIAFDNTLCHIAAITGKGIVDGLIEEGIEIPEIECIRGTFNGRVVLHFKNGAEKMSSPLDHLRARLKRRFSQKK